MLNSSDQLIKDKGFHLGLVQGLWWGFIIGPATYRLLDLFLPYDWTNLVFILLLVIGGVVGFWWMAKKGAL